MILIVGGAYQGKGEFALRLAGGREAFLLLNVHERIRAELLEGKTRDEIEKDLLEEIHLKEIRLKEAHEKGQMILTADEVGSGIVPVDADLREYRETTGRILCVLAGESEEVYRVVAGIFQKIKG